MNIKQLESFICIVERGSFAAAAEVLFTTQSSISARIQELEKHLGVPLFDRSQHRARLAPKGEELLPYARQVVQLSQDVTRRISDPNSLDGVVRIGVVGLVAITLLPRLIMEIRRSYPKIILQIHMYLTRVLFEKLHDGKLDIALLTAPVTEPDVETFSLGHDHFVWMASPSLNIPNRVLSPQDLQKWPIVGFSVESHHYPVIDKWFSDNNTVYTPEISCNNMDILADLTVAGVGVGLLPKRCYENLIKKGQLSVLRTTPKNSRVEFVAIYKRNALLHPLVNTVATIASRLGTQDGLLHAKSVNTRLDVHPVAE